MESIAMTASNKTARYIATKCAVGGSKRSYSLLQHIPIKGGHLDLLDNFVLSSNFSELCLKSNHIASILIFYLLSSPNTNTNTNTNHITDCQIRMASFAFNAEEVPRFDEEHQAINADDAGRFEDRHHGK
jgi:hypothetical protein